MCSSRRGPDAERVGGGRDVDGEARVKHRISDVSQKIQKIILLLKQKSVMKIISRATKSTVHSVYSWFHGKGDQTSRRRRTAGF